jgi:probable rRNA maturation factor
MFHPELINHPENFIPDDSRIQEIFQTVSQEVDTPQSWTIHIAFLSDDEIQALNREYRWIDKSTDVLSFHYFEELILAKNDDIVGEIVLSESKIRTQALEHHHSEREEFEILIIHGLLHILGFDHEEDEDYEVMWKYEKEIRVKLGVSVI